MSDITNRFSRRTIALFWCLVIGLVIGIIIYFEQIALLYVIATLAIVLLLLIVGFSDLEKVGRENVEGFADESE